VTSGAENWTAMRSERATDTEVTAALEGHRYEVPRSTHRPLATNRYSKTWFLLLVSIIITTDDDRIDANKVQTRLEIRLIVIGW